MQGTHGSSNRCEGCSRPLVSRPASSCAQQESGRRLLATASSEQSGASEGGGHTVCAAVARRAQTPRREGEIVSGERGLALPEQHARIAWRQQEGGAKQVAWLGPPRAAA